MTTMQTLSNAPDSFESISAFILGHQQQKIPESAINTAKLLVLDLIGVLAAAAKLDAGLIARNHAVKHWAAGASAPAARLLFDGRPTSLPGFSFAMATQLDNLDAHDGWQPSRGHAGAALLPALCAFAEGCDELSGRDALCAMVVGYEIAYRAATALHSTVADYHTSGAWNSLGCAAVGARLRKLNPTQLRHALGIAEYHSPRSQMMREIANPTMLHDGTGWGAPTGVYAVLVAEDGFKGAPAATIEFDDAAASWVDLEKTWLTNQQYIKPYPICRWAHAPIDAALNLRREHSLTADMIESVSIETFKYSAALSVEVPTTTSRAQYAIAWPVAAALARGCVGVEEVLESSFSDPELITLTERTGTVVDAEIDAGFPEHRLARVVVKLNDGRLLDSGVTTASGGPDPQPTEQEVVTKFRAYAATVMPPARVQLIESAVMSLDSYDANFKTLMDLLVDK